MARNVDLSISITRSIDKMEKRIKNLQPLMKEIGALISGECRRAFTAQALGDLKWPARYEGMSDPFINIAGALMDWNNGRPNPKPNRFQDRPALVDEGMRGGMWGSITHNTNENTARVGTNKDYAALHQEGGETEIPISEGAKDKIWEWLFDFKPGEKRVATGKRALAALTTKTVSHHGRSGQEGPMVPGKILGYEIVRKGGGLVTTPDKKEAAAARKAGDTVTVIRGEDKRGKIKTDRAKYLGHLQPLLTQPIWEQSVAARPFIGVTDKAAEEITHAVEAYFKVAAPKEAS